MRKPQSLDQRRALYQAQEALGGNQISRVRVDFVPLEVEADTPAEAARAKRHLEAIYGHLSPEQRASLRCVWNGRKCASIEDRNTRSLWRHTKSDVAAADQWRRDFPDSEFTLFRLSGHMSVEDQELTMAMLYEADRVGCSTAAVVANATYPMTAGEVSIDFSDLRGEGWPKSWQFNARWHVKFNRTWASGHPTIELVLTRVERALPEVDGPESSTTAEGQA